MENLEAGYDSATWDKLAHRMDFEAQEEVDNLFKDRLGSVEAPLVAGSWEAMEKMIEADEVTEKIETEAQVDSIAYEKLHNLRVPYQSEHWALMVKRLEEEYSLRHILYRYKVAEISLMALLLLTIIRFMPLMEDLAQGVVQNEQQQTMEQQPILPTDKMAIPSILPTLDIASLVQLNTANPLADATSGVVPTSATGNVLIPSVRNGGVQFTSTNKSPFESTSPNWRGQYLSILPKKEMTPLQSIPGTKTVIEEFASKQDKLLAMASKRQADMDAVAGLPVGQVKSAKYSWELPTVETPPSKKKTSLRFSIFTTTDLNYVTTPPNRYNVFGDPVETQYNETSASGYGGGVTVSWKWGRWEYQTGGIYSFKRYIPNTPIFIFNTPNFFIREDFNGIQLDIFQVPLNVHYHFKDMGKWRFYATAGMSANFVTSTIYEFEYEKQALNLLPPSEGSSPEDNKSIRQEKEFPSGLADGGHLRDNFYMSANLGLGMERYLSPKWTVFFQPNYQHFITSKGIGTNMDKIYTTSFHLGTKFNLK